MQRQNHFIGIASFLGLATIVACGDGNIGTSGNGPHVQGFDHDQVVVGQTLSFIGSNFAEPKEGHTVVHFDGIFYARMADGTEVPKWSTFKIRPIYDGRFPEGGSVNGKDLSPGTQLLRWNRFGPFRNPFHAINEPGRFEGTVTAVNVYPDGTEVQDSEPRTLQLQVAPSIVINRLEPIVDVEDGRIVTAGCSAPALRAFGALPYVMEVEAMGFRPVSFTYRLSSVNGELWATFEHDARGVVDVLGDPEWYPGEMVVFDELPRDAEKGYSTVTVTAHDAQGNSYFTALPLSIVRPLQFFHDGKRRLAEYYEPIAVHGPIIGALGTSLSYSESHSESRQQGVSVSVSQNFTESQNITNTQNWAEGMSVTDTTSTSVSDSITQSESETASETYGESYTHSEGTNTSLSSTNGSSWGWNSSTSDSVEDYTSQVDEVFSSNSHNVKAGGEISIPVLSWLSGSVGYDYGRTTGDRESNTTGHREGHSETNGESYSESASTSETFGSTTSDSRSETFGGSYSVGTQSSIANTTTQSEASSESVSWSMGTSEGISEGYSYGESETWNESWASTTSDSTLLGYSSRLPMNACAVVYRQTVRYVRTAHLFAYDNCGVRTHVSEMNFNEWTWAPNIALAEDCTNSLPDSTQPKAQCFYACD